MERAAERTDRVYLAPGEARCEPRLHCPPRSHCARYMATIPVMGSVMDGSADPLWTHAGCPHYLPAVHAVKHYNGPERRKMKHWGDDE